MCHRNSLVKKVLFLYQYRERCTVHDFKSNLKCNTFQDNNMKLMEHIEISSYFAKNVTWLVIAGRLEFVHVTSRLQLKLRFRLTFFFLFCFYPVQYDMVIKITYCFAFVKVRKNNEKKEKT